jgi:hypothetical protein
LHPYIQGLRQAGGWAYNGTIPSVDNPKKFWHNEMNKRAEPKKIIPFCLSYSSCRLTGNDVRQMQEEFICRI